MFNAALADAAPEVRTEAIRGVGFLASHGSNAAMEQLIKLVLDQDEDGRRLAAELLARCGEEGYQILREAAGEEDIKVRRAAAYGLAATDQDWARDLLRKLERDDKQWFVRSAATDALSLMQARVRPATADAPLDLTPIVIDQQGWLVEWAAQQGVGIGVGRQANEAMLRAMARRTDARTFGGVANAAAHRRSKPSRSTASVALRSRSGGARSRLYGPRNDRSTHRPSTAALISKQTGS